MNNYNWQVFYPTGPNLNQAKSHFSTKTSFYSNIQSAIYKFALKLTRTWHLDAEGLGKGLQAGTRNINS